MNVLNKEYNSSFNIFQLNVFIYSIITSRVDVLMLEPDWYFSFRVDADAEIEM